MRTLARESLPLFAVAWGILDHYILSLYGQKKKGTGIKERPESEKILDKL